MIWVVFKRKLHCWEIPKLSHLSFSPRKGEMGPHKGREKRQCWEIPTLSHSKNAWKNKSKGRHAAQSVGEAMLCKTLTSFVPLFTTSAVILAIIWECLTNQPRWSLASYSLGKKYLERLILWLCWGALWPSGHRNPLLMIHSWMNILWCLFSFEVGWLCLSFD